MRQGMCCAVTAEEDNCANTGQYSVFFDGSEAG